MELKSRAFVVHRTPNRIRIKIPGRERHDSYFAALQLMLAKRADVISVQVNPRVASVVIHCREEFEVASLHHWLDGLQCHSSAPRAGDPPADGTRDACRSSLWLVNVAIKLTIAIATRKVEALIREWIIGAAARALLELLRRTLAQPVRPEARRALGVAAAA